MSTAKTIYQIKITLIDSKPPIWRRFLVEETVTLGKLHEILQIVMGWTDSHTWLGTFRGLVAAQALLGVAVPLLIHRTLLPYGRRLAFATALAATVMPIPFVYAGMVMTEQLSFALQFLFLLFASRYVTGERPPVFLWLATLTAFAMVLTRPAAGLVFWAFLPVAMLAAPRRVKQPMLAAGLYCALMMGWSGVDWLGLGRGDQPSPGAGPASHRAEMPFERAYFSAWSENFRDYGSPRPHITPERGPASRALHECLSRYLREKPGSWVSREPQAWFGAFAGSPAALLEEFFRRPTADYFSFISAVVREELGPAAGDIINKSE